jgi:hypothetical protein
VLRSVGAAPLFLEVLIWLNDCSLLRAVVYCGTFSSTIYAEVACVMKPNVRVVTEFRCLCGRKLVLKEVSNVLMFGCPRCSCYVIVTESKTRPYYYSGMFNWRKLMKDLYDSYIEARRYICE